MAGPQLTGHKRRDPIVDHRVVIVRKRTQIVLVHLEIGPLIAIRLVAREQAVLLLRLLLRMHRLWLQRRLSIKLTIREHTIIEMQKKTH